MWGKAIASEVARSNAAGWEALRADSNSEVQEFAFCLINAQSSRDTAQCARISGTTVGLRVASKSWRCFSCLKSGNCVSLKHSAMEITFNWLRYCNGYIFEIEVQ